MDKQELIPKFSLYGESQDHYDSDLVHIESIAARSKKSHWNIQPHLHGKLFQVIIIISGNAEILLDNRDYTLKGNGAVIIPSGVVHSFRFPPQTDGYVLTIAEPLINHSTTSRAIDYLNLVIQTPRVLIFTPNSPFFNQLISYLETMLSEFQSYYSGKRYSIEWLGKMILMTIYREIETHENIEKSKNTDHKFYIFSNLIEVHFREQWTVSAYAKELGISVSTLNRLCHSEKKETAKQLIGERLMIEAKRCLIFTQSNIEQIAYRLGFEDPAYFSRFFKQKSAMSPKEFREKNPFETRFLVDKT